VPRMRTASARADARFAPAADLVLVCLFERTFRQVLQKSWRGERTLAMSFDVLCSPVQFLQQVGIFADQDWLREYEAWFEVGVSTPYDRVNANDSGFPRAKSILH